MNDDERTRVFGAAAGPRIEPGVGSSSGPGGDAAPHATSRLPIGTRFGEFEIVGMVGEGGFGIVYLAYDHALDYRLAIKEYMPSSLAFRSSDHRVTVKSERMRETFEAGLRSFVTEAKLLAQFDHPSLVKAFRLWEANGTAYMAMRFYEGVTLKDALARLGAPPTQAWLRALLGPLLDAVETLHVANVYHRDIAPDNVMILPDGRPVLLDFGAARRVIGDMTQALTVILKPGFAPVEQYAEIPDLAQGAWTDVYALCALVHYAIGGRTPPPSVSRMVRDSMVPARELGAGRFDAGFLDAIDRGLAVRPEHRPATIAALREALGLGHTGSPRGAGPSDPVGRAMTADPNERGDARAPAPPLSADDDPLGSILAGAAPGPSPAPVSAGESRAFMLSTDAASTPAGPSPSGPARPAAPDPAPGPRRWLSGAGLAVVAVAAAGGIGVLLYNATTPTARSVTADAGAGTPTVSSPRVDPTTTVPTTIPPTVTLPTPPTVPVTAPAASDTTPPFSTMALLDALERGASPERPIGVRVPQRAVAIGGQIKFSVKSERDGYLHVFLVGTDSAHLYRIFPNGLDDDNRIRAGVETTLPRTPRGRKPWSLQAGGPPGTNHFVAIVTDQPRDFTEAGLARNGDFPEFDLATLRRRWDEGADRAWIGGRPACPGGGAPCELAYGAARFTIEELARK
jgi:serine/threonine protein kinase